MRPIVASNGGRPPGSGFLEGGWDSEIRAHLEEMVTREPGVAAFDFDDTILDGDLSIALLTLLDERSPDDLRGIYEADCQRDVRSGYAKLVETLLVGRTEMEVRSLTREAYQRAVSNGSCRLRPELTGLIWAMQRHGWEVWVVTASPAVVISVVAQQVGIPAHHVLGMWCDTDEFGRFQAPAREPITYRQGKVDALQSVMGDTQVDFAAGDALTDLEMLRSARYALVLDRGNARLAEEASANGWWIQGGL